MNSTQIASELKARASLRSALKSSVPSEPEDKPTATSAVKGMLTPASLELLKKVRAYRESTSSKLQVKLPENLCATWVYNTPENIFRYQQFGYRFPKPEEIKANVLPVDSLFKHGDLILMVIDRELKEVMDVDQAIRAVESVESGRNIFREFAEENRIPYSEEN